MAATPGILNGTDLLVYDNTHAFTHAQTCSIAINRDMRDASTKASAGWKAVLPGQASWQVETSGLVAMDASYNLAYLANLFMNKTRIALKFKTTNADNSYFYGYAYLGSMPIEAPNQGNTTYQATFIGDGALTLSTGVITEITEYTADFSITGADTYLLINKGSAIAGIFDAVATFPGHVTIKNIGAGTCSLTAVGGVLMDGQATIQLVTGQSIVVFPNVTKFEVMEGEYTIPL